MIRSEVGNKEQIKVLHVNIRSLRKNWDSLRQQLKEINIDWELIILTEINIKKEEIELYDISGYANTTITRESTTRGGGIMVFTKKELNIEVKQIEFGENNVLKIIITGMNVKGKKEKDIQIIAVYRKPSTNKKEFVKTLKNWVENNGNKNFKSQMIVGDINIDILENLNQLEDNYDQNLIDYYEYIPDRMT